MHSFTHHVRLPASCNNAPQLITMFLVSIIVALCRLPVYCNRESMGQVLELLVMMYIGDLKGGMPRLIRELNITVAYQLFLK